MEKYKGFNIGEIVVLNKDIVCQTDYKDKQRFRKGEKFKIKSFPPCTIPEKYKYFVYGKNFTGITVRCDIDDINKLK